jgi:hypothetical protein
MASKQTHICPLTGSVWRKLQEQRPAGFKRISIPGKSLTGGAESEKFLLVATPKRKVLLVDASTKKGFGAV